MVRSLRRIVCGKGELEIDAQPRRMLAEFLMRISRAQQLFLGAGERVFGADPKFFEPGICGEFFGAYEEDGRLFGAS